MISRMTALLHHLPPTTLAQILVDIDEVLLSDVPDKMNRRALESVATDATKVLHALVGLEEAADLQAACEPGRK